MILRLPQTASTMKDAAALAAQGQPHGTAVIADRQTGGITLETVRLYAETGADFVSVGAITHSARAVDISFKLELA